MTFEQPARKKGRRPSGPPFVGRVLLYSGLYSFWPKSSCTGSAQALPKPYSLTPKP